jgi:hypothetical protein
MLTIKVSAIQARSHSLLCSSSIHEPSDPPHRIVSIFILQVECSIRSFYSIWEGWEVDRADAAALNKPAHTWEPWLTFDWQSKSSVIRVALTQHLFESSKDRLLSVVIDGLLNDTQNKQVGVWGTCRVSQRRYPIYYGSLHYIVVVLWERIYARRLPLQATHRPPPLTQ